MEENDLFVKQFAFVFVLLFFTLGLISAVLMYMYSKEIDWNLDENRTDFTEYLSSSINYFYFLAMLIALNLILLLIGVKFLLSHEVYWKLMEGFFVVSTAMIVSYVPWFEKLRRLITTASPYSLFIATIIFLILLIFIFAI